jgi:heterodisulfide reductase subunit C
MRQASLDEFLRVDKSLQTRAEFNFSKPFGGCMRCGVGVCTGSSLWYVCPVDRSWRTAWDKCKYIESFTKTYGREPNENELKTYIQYIENVRKA